MWDVIVRRELRPLIDALKGKKTGYPAAYQQLCRDPCAEFPTADGRTAPFAYRLSGPLRPKVCGTHVKRGYRLAFSMRPSDDDRYEGIVEILYVGTRDTRDRSKDTWTIVHDLFGEQNPPDQHLRPPCCQDGLPVIDEDELAEFMRRLRRLLRPR
jgi:hypothetical protein